MKKLPVRVLVIPREDGSWRDVLIPSLVCLRSRKGARCPAPCCCLSLSRGRFRGGWLGDVVTIGLVLNILKEGVKAELYPSQELCP